MSSEPSSITAHIRPAGRMARSICVRRFCSRFTVRLPQLHLPSSRGPLASCGVAYLWAFRQDWQNCPWQTSHPHSSLNLPVLRHPHLRRAWCTDCERASEARQAHWTSSEASSVAPVSRYLIFHHKSVDQRAIAQVAATPALFSPAFFGSYIPAPRKPETDGLSRNRADCVRYGCIDNGG
jgi:hypothetical protein